MREEGGTPAIVESVRAGLVFQLKEVQLIFIAGIYFGFIVQHHSFTDHFTKNCKLCKHFSFVIIKKCLYCIYVITSGKTDHLVIFSKI